jgi:hypothetical protein
MAAGGTAIPLEDAPAAFQRSAQHARLLMALYGHVGLEWEEDADGILLWVRVS